MTATPRVTDDSPDRSTGKIDGTAGAPAQGGPIDGAASLEKADETAAGAKATPQSGTTSDDAAKRTAPRRSLNVKEIPPFEWKLVGKSRGVFLTLFKAVSRDDVEAQLERVRHDGYYTETSILPLDEPIRQPRLPFGRRRTSSASSASKAPVSAPGKTPQATVIRLKSRKPDGDASAKKASTSKRKAKATTAAKSKAKATTAAKKKTKRAATKESAPTSTVKAKKTTKRKAAKTSAKSSAAKVAKKKTKKAAAKPVARKASRKKA